MNFVPTEEIFIFFLAQLNSLFSWAFLSSFVIQRYRKIEKITDLNLTIAFPIHCVIPLPFLGFPQIN